MRRRTNPTGVLLIAAITLSVAVARGRTTASGPEPLTIGGYALVSAQPFDQALDDETYTATLTNTGGPTGNRDATSVAATFYSRSPFVRPIDRDLTFGNVRARTTVRSRDTFIVRKPRGVPLDPASIQWQIVSRPDVILPESWAGTWRLRVSYFDIDSGNLEARDTITDIIRPDDALGLSSVQAPAKCVGSATLDHLDAGCRLDVNTGACSMQGQLQLSGALSGNTLQGGGQWVLTAGGGCGPFVRSGGQRIEFIATRTSGSIAAPYGSATTLAAKFVPPFAPISER